jgi:lysophospholipase L1-like esterase
VYDILWEYIEEKMMKRLFVVVMAAVMLSSAALIPGTVSAQTTTREATTQAAPQKTYAALGDSVAAGLGLPGVPSPKGTDTLCGRSNSSYTNIVAKNMRLRMTKAACSGATVGDLFTKQAVNGPNITAQLDTAFAGGTPSLITITAGANDAHWDSFIRGCYATDCTNQATNLIAQSYLVALQAKLYLAFGSIYLRSGGHPPTVVVTGYYNPLSASCTGLTKNITPAEITWLTGETTALNRTIQSVAAQYSFVKFAPVNFDGHDICSGRSWVQGVADAAPFHPTATGQGAIAASVLRTLGK